MTNPYAAPNLLETSADARIHVDVPGVSARVEVQPPTFVRAAQIFVDGEPAKKRSLGLSAAIEAN